MYRQLMSRFATGVAVVLSESGDGPVGLTVNSLTSVSLDPVLLLFCARHSSRTIGPLLAIGRFSVNVLCESQCSISQYFAGQTECRTPIIIERQDGFAWLAESNAVLRCRVYATYAGGDHQIVVGNVVSMHGPALSRPPLLYHEGKYLRVNFNAADVESDTSGYGAFD
jgi:flavin reductase (DIM6/NTAB) family NADH-FMN oxidoreductase RutF